MILSKDINKGLRKIMKYDSVISVSEIHQLIWFGKNPSYNINNRKRRQLSKKTFLETGSFFITSRKILLNIKIELVVRLGLLKLIGLRSFDIDTIQDLEIIRKLLK